jgi:hypothetical protein
MPAVVTPSGELALVYGNIAYPVISVLGYKINKTNTGILFITKQKI